MHLRWPLPPIVIICLTALVLTAFHRHANFRMWAAAIDIRWLVGFHLTRFVGFYFLLLQQRGLLPREFVAAGWGDIFVAALAVVLLLLVRPGAPGSRPAYLLWNAAGLSDILFVVMTAARLGMSDATKMQQMLVLPLSLLPTFVVPLIISSHVIMLSRLLGSPTWGSPGPRIPLTR